MLGKSVLFRPSSTDIDRRMSAVLRAAGNEVIVDRRPNQCVAVVEAGAIDAVVIDTSDDLPLRSVAEEAIRRDVPVVLLSDTVDSEAIEIFCDGLADHLVFGRDRALGGGVAVEKLLRESYFGIEKYLPRYGLEVYRFELRGASTLRDALECLDDLVRTIGGPEGASAELLEIAGELGENAIYSAPRRSDGRRRYTPKARQKGIDVSPAEFAELAFAFDGRSVIISVSDRFGSLDPRQIRNHLWRGQDRAHTAPQKLMGKRGPRGLRRVWELTSELTFNIENGARTEVIARRELFPGDECTGVHIYSSGYERILAGAVESTVKVSDSMLVDIRQHLAVRNPAPAVTLVAKRPMPENDRALSQLETEKMEPIFDDGITEPRNQLVSTPDEPVGIDTLMGLLHGATSVRRALEIGLRFVTVCYQGAVAYRIDSGVLHPVMAAGNVANWPELQQLPIDMFSPSTLAAMTASGLSGRYQPSEDHELDPTIADLTVAQDDPEGYVITVKLHGEPRYAVFAFGRRYTRHLAKRVAKHLETELSEGIAKQLGEWGGVAVRRTSSVH